MGLCASAPKSRTNPERNNFQKPNLFTQNNPTPSVNNPQKFSPQTANKDLKSSIPGFSEFSFGDLKNATNNFSSELIVSGSGEKAPNVVYKGRLKNRRWIAVKKFSNLAWPDPKQFVVINIISLNLVMFFYIPEMLVKTPGWMCIENLKFLVSIFVVHFQFLN